MLVGIEQENIRITDIAHQKSTILTRHSVRQWLLDPVTGSVQPLIS